MNLNTSLTQLNRVGKTLSARLKKLGILTAQDLLFYFPFRYEDFSQVKKIKDLVEGEQVSVKGKIEIIESKRSFRKRAVIIEAVVADETDRIKVVWFGQPFISKTLKVGDEVYLSGKVKAGMFGMEMVSPGYERVKINTTHTARIVPMYSLTSGITNKQMRFLMEQVIGLASEIPEWLPEDIMEKVDLSPLPEAIRGIHFPIDDNDLKHAEKRIKFGELFVTQLRAEMSRRDLQKLTAPVLKFNESATKEFVACLPYQLTQKQKVSAWEILQDMAKSTPMNRLLEGDVGSGKTVVAAMAMYNAVLNGYQAVLMAPTEILAEQHFQTLSKLFGEKVKLGLLTRSQFQISEPSLRATAKQSSRNERWIATSSAIERTPRNDRRKLLEFINNGDAQIVIGTHALLTEKVEFNKLGLVIVDEQHRFGVEQRKMLKSKGNPHFLSMTATPIPRSFALAVYGDLDLSILDEMPIGRKPVKTRLVEPHNRAKAYQFIREQVKQGRQVFVICPLIEESEKVKAKKSEGQIEIINYPENSFTFDEKKTVMNEYEKLSKKIFPDLRVGFVHGKLKALEKQKIMEQFNNGTVDILVATSVVEVGVNIPNASVMMIEGAERFGLAQLHQFRGRVGRSSHQSFCFLFTNSDSAKALERLKFFENNTNGFRVAEYDLEVRGPGEVYGTTQSGLMNFRLATLKDGVLIKLARDLANGIDFKKFPILVEKVKEFEKGIHLE